MEDAKAGLAAAQADLSRTLARDSHQSDAGVMKLDALTLLKEDLEATKMAGRARVKELGARLSTLEALQKQGSVTMQQVRAAEDAKNAEAAKLMKILEELRQLKP